MLLHPNVLIHISSYPKKEYLIIHSNELQKQWEIYREMPVSSINIVKFWDKFSHLNLLYRLAMMCISIPVSASACERVFSIYAALMASRPNAKRDFLKTVCIAKFNKGIK